MNVVAVLEKVRKLRALSTSSNVHEAAAAAAAAERLLQEHRLVEADLEAAGAEARTRAGAVCGGTIHVEGARRTLWRVQLATNLARAHGCETYLEPHAVADGAIRRLSWHHVILGRPDDVENVKYVFGWLSSVITQLVERHGKGRGISWRRSFCIGAVFGIREAMEAAAAVVRSRASSSALVVLDARRSAAASLLPKGLRSTSCPTVRDASAFDIGKETGRLLHVGPALIAKARAASV